MAQPELIPHLFRTEFRKITAVLCRLLGTDHIDVAEDIASETFLQALETWPFKGIPAEPVAWLYLVAKNKAKNYIARNHVFTEKVAAHLKHTSPVAREIEVDLSEKNITDSQLQMLFAVCHPSLSAEAQIALALRILCGFGIEEIAVALLTNKETINKRLLRAKERMRVHKIKIEFPGRKEINKRLANVLTTLYLLFSEGYYSESHDAVLREELCLEAMRLACLLTENSQTNQPPVNALLSLMCFHASRFAARKDQNGEMILYGEQDEMLWNRELIARGAWFLKEASQGNTISKYHLEANIAYWHTIRADTKEKWENIVHLFDQLLQIEYSPVAALNRIYALSRAEGEAVAIREAERLNLVNNHFYFTLLGELYKGTDEHKARQHLEKAFSLARSLADRSLIRKKIEALNGVAN